MLTVALSVYKKLLSTDCQGRGVSLWTGVYPPPSTHTSIQNKANVPFHQPGPLLAFEGWGDGPPFPFWPSMVSLGTITEPVMVRGEWIFVLQWRRNELEVRDQTILKTILILAGSSQFLWDPVFLNIYAPVLILLTLVPPPSCLTSIDTISIVMRPS